jgi:undecaprenyl-diphosphatase
MAHRPQRRKSVYYEQIFNVKKKRCARWPLDDFFSISIGKKRYSMLYFYIYCILQIVLESFPVSSSSHLVLLERYLRSRGYTINHHQGFFFNFLNFDFVSIDVLVHFLHGVTACVLALFFFPRWRIFIMHMRRSWRIGIKIILLAMVADFFTAMGYVFFVSYPCACMPLGLGLFVTGCLLVSLRLVPTKKSTVFSWRQASLLGIVQGLALLPGISRFASTYVAGRWLLLRSDRAFEISFLLQWPLITLAFLNSVRMLAAQTNVCFLFDWHLFLIMGCAGIIAFYCLRLVYGLAMRRQLWLFAFYMLVPLYAWLLLC